MKFFTICLLKNYKCPLKKNTICSPENFSGSATDLIDEKFSLTLKKNSGSATNDIHIYTNSLKL